MPGVAYGAERPRSRGYCPNWKWKDDLFRLARDAAYQCVGVLSLHAHVLSSRASLANRYSIPEMGQ